MKKLSLLLFTLTICFFTACHKDIWAELDELDQRVTKLEELCKEMNTNIASLQTIVSLLQSNDFITGVVEIKKDGEVIGYTITFGKHDPITIYHGQDGKDGQDGANGSSSTPVIGVAQDTDGVYYWTLNGEWLLDDNGNKLPVSGTNGKDGQNGTNGSNGQDGADGKDGQDGKDGITPQLKIEEGYWYISYDNGTTWTQLGKATGEDGKDGQNGSNGTDGKDGKDGQDGDSMFQSVTQDENYVYFTLADGTVIKIAKGSGSNDQPNGEDYIEFTDFHVRLELIDMGVDTNQDGEISYNEAANVTRLDFSGRQITSFRELQYFTNLTAISLCNTKVREIQFPDNGIDSILNSAFQGVSLKDLVITDGTKYIGKSAFSSSSIENLVLPHSINCIDDYAFKNSSIKSFVFPPNITYMPEGSFEGCKNLEDFTFPENYDGETFLFGKTVVGNGVHCGTPPKRVYWNTVNYSKRFKNDSWYGIEAVTYSSAKCYGPCKIESIIFGEKVQIIPADICHGMEKLEQIVIPNSVTHIKEEAFMACTSLNTVTIGDGVTHIEKSSFYGCSKLQSVVIGKSISDIGNYVFYYCTSMKYLYCKATTPPLLGTSAIPTTIGIIYVPRTSVDEYKALWSDYADKIIGYDFE